MSKKISMKTALVEMDGDEMTRIIWRQVKETLICPFVDLRTDYYDLGLVERQRTGDAVTIEAAEATLRHGVAVKCATITPNAQRQEEYQLTQLWKSPNATIRAILDGTVFRVPVTTQAIKPVIASLVKPLTIARHAYGDVYRDVEMEIPAAGTVELVYRDATGREQRREDVHHFEDSGVVLAMHNIDSSIATFARTCFSYALETKQDLWFSTKDTISKHYDHRFKELFQKIFDAEFAGEFQRLGLKYFYTLIDDAVARVVRSSGGFIWACKNYDGDVMSDMVAAVYGSLAMMTSVLLSPHGAWEYEAAHGTVTRHYYRYLKGETTSTNPVATIFAWSGALRKRGELDNLHDLVAFAENLEKSVVATIDSGLMTADLAALSHLPQRQSLSSQDFMNAVACRLSDSSRLLNVPSATL